MKSVFIRHRQIDNSDGVCGQSDTVSQSEALLSDTDGVRVPGQSCRGIPELRPQASFMGGTLLGRGFVLGGASLSPPGSLRALPWQLWTRPESLVSSANSPPPTRCLRSGGPGA